MRGGLTRLDQKAVQLFVSHGTLTEYPRSQRHRRFIDWEPSIELAETILMFKEAGLEHRVISRLVVGALE